MKRLLAATLAVWVAGWVGGAGAATAGPGHPADGPTPAPAPPPVGDAATPDLIYAVGGARPPGIPWADYTKRAGSGYYPDIERHVIDYPAGAMFSWVPSIFAPTEPRDNVSVGVAVGQATNTLDTAVRSGTQPAVVVGLSQGTMALDQEQIRLATDPAAPPAHMLQFTTFGGPLDKHAFGQGVGSGLFPPGSYIPFFDYTVPQPVDSQYDTNRVAAAYDAFADFPDRPDNLLAVANSLFGAAFVHTPAAFTSPDVVPPENIRSTVNSRGATTTSYLIPVNHLPLTMPLRFLGVPDGLVDQLDGVLQPQVDSGYSRNDNPATKPTTVDPVRGMDPASLVGPEADGAMNQAVGALRSFFGPIG